MQYRSAQAVLKARPTRRAGIVLRATGCDGFVRQTDGIGGWQALQVIDSNDLPYRTDRLITS
jgi:hypothetical protein